MSISDMAIDAWWEETETIIKEQRERFSDDFPQYAEQSLYDEALRIAKGDSMLLPTKAHLRAVLKRCGHEV